MEIVQRALKKVLPVSLMAFGIGMFLGLTLGFLLFIGGIIRWYVDRRAPGSYQQGILYAAGLMGGEGISGFVTAALFVGGIAMVSAQRILLVIFVILLVITFVVYTRSRRNQ